MLATRLRELEAAGVLHRLPLRHNTRAYALTDRGLALRATIIALGRWGADLIDRVYSDVGHLERTEFEGGANEGR